MERLPVGGKEMRLNVLISHRDEDPAQETWVLIKRKKKSATRTCRVQVLLIDVKGVWSARFRDLELLGLQVASK